MSQTSWQYCACGIEHLLCSWANCSIEFCVARPALALAAADTTRPTVCNYRRSASIDIMVSTCSVSLCCWRRLKTPNLWWLIDHIAIMCTVGHSMCQSVCISTVPPLLLKYTRYVLCCQLPSDLTEWNSKITSHMFRSGTLRSGNVSHHYDITLTCSMFTSPTARFPRWNIAFYDIERLVHVILRVLIVDHRVRHHK